MDTTDETFKTPKSVQQKKPVKRKFSECETEDTGEENINSNVITSTDNKNRNGKSDDNESKVVTGIWELHRYCAQNKLESPCFKVVETTDYFNNKLFTVQCSIRDLHGTATGKKKKEAKHKASYVLLDQLKYNEKYGRNIMNDNDEDSLEEGEINDLEEGEIKESQVVDNKSVSNNTSQDDVPLETNKYKSYKVYMEGNVTKSNTINNQNTIKSDMERLTEFCFEQKLPAPRYEINEHVGLRSLIITCKCSVLQLVVRTSGPNKLHAKEKAAKMLLTKMEQHVDILKSDDVNNNTELEEGEIIENSGKENTEMNRNKRKRCKQQMQRKGKRFKFENEEEPLVAKSQNELGMGDLYNFCLKLKIPPPVYTMIDKQDFSATKTVFTFKCSVLKFSKLGKGLNKKQAKHRAAKLVLEKLQNWNKEEMNQDDDSEILEEGELTEKDELVKKEYIKHKLENNFVTHEEKSSLQLQCITERHNIVKTGKPYTDSVIIKKLNELEDEFLRRHAIVIFKHLCKELDCTYSFIDIKSQMTYLSTVLMNSMPPWSMFGKGKSAAEAQIDAVTKLLNFLKFMKN